MYSIGRKKPLGIKKKVIYMCIFTLLFLIFLGWYLYYQNNAISVLQHKVKLSQQYGGYKILQIADLQNTTFGKNQDNLMKQVKEVDPNIIVFTGDLFDRRRYEDKTFSYELIDRLNDLKYPMYYVSGNHECWSGHHEEIIRELFIRGVHVLDNNYAILKANDKDFALLGLMDPAMYYPEKHRKYKIYKSVITVNDYLRELVTATEGYDQVLLSHRPELIDLYVDNNIPLVLAGHAHGGQFRIPYVGGVYAPSQGFFPEYSEGIHQVESTQLVISRGLGNSSFPFRVNNTPELVVIELE